MKSTLALVVAASVLMMTGLTVMLMTSNSIGVLDDDADDTKKDGRCSFQAKQYCQEKADIGQVDEECLAYVENYDCSDTQVEEALDEAIPKEPPEADGTVPEDDPDV